MDQGFMYIGLSTDNQIEYIPTRCILWILYKNPPEKVQVENCRNMNTKFMS